MIKYGIEGTSLQDFVIHIVSMSARDCLEGKIKVVITEHPTFENFMISHALTVGEIDIIERTELVCVENLNDLFVFFNLLESEDSEVCILAIHNVFKSFVDNNRTRGSDFLTAKDLNRLFFSLKTLQTRKLLEVYIGDAYDGLNLQEPAVWGCEIPSADLQNSHKILVKTLVSKWSAPYNTSRVVPSV